MFKRFFGLSIFMFFFLNLLSGQDESPNELFTQYKFHRLNEDHGLRNNVIIDINQDTLGQIWVATELGLFRYEGSRFTAYYHNQDKINSLPNNYVNDILIDNENTVWLMTEYGIGKYDYEYDEIIKFKPKEINEPVTSMVLDKNGNKYFGLYNGGIINLNSNLNYLNLFDRKSGNDFSRSSITHMCIIEDNLWAVVASDGLIRINLVTEEITHVNPSFFGEREGIVIFGIYSDRSKTLWIASDSGLFRVPEDHQSSISVEKVLSELLPVDDYLSFYEDEHNTVWVGTRQNGLYLFPNKDDVSVDEIQHFTVTESENGLSYRTVSKIFQDESGLFWLGTHNGGINVFNPNGEKIRLLSHEKDNSNSLSFTNVRSLAESSSGRVWIGTDGGGVNVLDPFNRKVNQVNWQGLEKIAVLSLLEDSNKRLWIGTYENGIYLVDLKTNSITRFKVGASNSELIVNDIRSIFQSSNDNILIGTNRGGAYQYDEKSGVIRRLPNTNGYDIRSIEMSDDGTLWMGTYRNGLLAYNTATSKIDKYLLSNNKNFNVVIFDLCFQDDILWLATRERGLVRFDIKKKKLEFDLMEDLSGVSVFAVTNDSNSNIWMTTSSGIYAYNDSSNSTYFFDNNDGFQKGYFNDGAILSSSKEYILVGGVNGASLFNPVDLLENRPSNRIVFSGLKILDKVVTPLNSDVFPEDKSIFLCDKIELNHSDNVFTLSYSIPGFRIARRDEFEFMMEGYDDNWQRSGFLNEVIYRNLPPGKYDFLVRNSRNKDVLNGLSIKVNPPLWKTWQAYLLFSLILVLLAWWYIRFNNSRLLLQKNLEFEQSLREKEKASMQEKLRFYTNFSHELKTPLTLIQGPVNDLIKKEVNPETIKYLQLIKRNTSILLKFIERMLEFRKIEMNKVMLNIGKHDLNILAQEEAESFKQLFMAKDVMFGFYCEHDLYAWVDIEKIQIVLNNLLSNAVKYSPAGTTVKFGMFHENDDIIIEVKDQGLGISSDEIDHIFSPFYQASNSAGSGGTGIGLALCKSFIDLHNGLISVISNEKAGTEFKVRLRKGREHFEGLKHIRFVEVNDEDQDLTSESLAIQGDNHSLSDSDKLLVVVDDNKDITAYIKSLFNDDFKVITCEKAEDAFEISTELIPDLIISDLMMSGIDGLEFCEMLKKNMATSHIPIILLTAKNSNVAKIKGFESGADDYVTKPFSSDLLKVRVNNLLKNRRLLELKYASNDLIDTESIKSSKEVEFVLQVESTIYSMLDSSEFSVPDLCKEIGMSQTSLYRKIKSITGDSIQLFIRKIKIKRAAQLLVSEDMKVTEVAFALDFSDLKYFRKCFKEQFNVTPSEYKNQHVSSTTSKDIEELMG